MNRVNDIGQSLLEVTITIGVSTLIVTALVIVTVVGLKNSELSQNQSQATKLAQEGLEKVRSMKDRNTPICVNTAAFYWDSGSTVWNNNDLGGIDFKLGNGNGDDPNCQLTNQPPSETLLNNKFTRKVNIDNTADGSNGSKKITCIVSWLDSSGSHQSQLTTYLTNY